MITLGKLDHLISQLQPTQKSNDSHQQLLKSLLIVQIIFFKKKHHAPIPTVQWLIYPMQHQFSKIINGNINTSISVALKSSWRTDCRAETAVYIILEICNIRPSNNAMIFSSKKTKNHPNPSNLVYMNSKAIDQITTIPFPTCKIIIIPRKPNKTG